MLGWKGRPWAPASSFAPDELAADPNEAARCVAPADRPRAERALHDFFGPVPFEVEWLGSPRGVARALQRHLDEEPDDLDEESPVPVRAVKPPWSFWSLDRRSTRDDVPGRAGGDDIAALRRACGAILGVLPGRRAAVGDAGQFDWRIVVEMREGSAGSALDRDGHLRLMHELRLAAGPTVILPSRVLLSERPLRLRLDEEERPHSEDGPAIAYPDGLAVWAIHGVVVPAWLLRHPERLTAAAVLKERNAEVRRVMLERFGMERLVREGHAVLVHEDERGRLLRVGPSTVRGRSGETVMVVEVRNATPEPDGSRKTYLLRVPPSMTTAREAVAWTFGMEGAEYEPLEET